MMGVDDKTMKVLEGKLLARPPRWLPFALFPRHCGWKQIASASSRSPIYDFAVWALGVGVVSALVFSCVVRLGSDGR